MSLPKRIPLRHIDGGITQVRSGITQLRDELKATQAQNTSLIDTQKQSAEHLAAISKTLGNIHSQIENDPIREVHRRSANELGGIAKTIRSIESRIPTENNFASKSSGQWQNQVLEKLDRLALNNQTRLPTLVPTQPLRKTAVKKRPKLQDRQDTFPYWIPTMAAGVGAAAIVGTAWALHENDEAHRMAEWEEVKP